MRKFNLAALTLLALPTLGHASGVFDNIPGLDDYALVYEAQLPNTGARMNTTGAAYAYNGTAAFTQPFTRVGYYMELQQGANPLRYVYVEADALTANYGRLGVPTTPSGAFFQQNLSNARVVSNHPGVTNGTGLNTLNIEFWPNNYTQSNNTIPASPANANDGLYDFGDTPTPGNHGSMQIHNFGEGRTIFGMSDWGGNNAGANIEIGIGNNPSGQPDWTFTDNANTYSVKNFAVVVDAQPNTPFVPKTLAGVPANIAANVPAAELHRYRLAYTLNVPNSAVLNASVPYAVDNSAMIPAGSFDRVAYYVELQAGTGPLQYVWVSADAFTLDASKLGVPTVASGEFFQSNLSNGNVYSNVVANGVGLDGLNIEFWPSNYDTTNALGLPGASDSLFDFGDRATAGNYGSMQIHNAAAGQTLFGYNRWGGAGGTSDLGIGNSPTGNPDWTFRQNANSYTIKSIQILVHAVPEPASASLLALTTAAALLRRRR